jgi:predicted lipoprotein with Yx(FWY)xxD motif
MNTTIISIAAVAVFGLVSVISADTAIADSHGNKFVHSRAFNGHIYVMYQDHMSLYTYSEDEIGKSNCYNECAKDWHPATLDAETKLGESYSLINRADGTIQAAFRGMPLYLYSKDRKPGDIYGDGVDGVWHLARP